MYVGIFPRNQWSSPATIERVRLNGTSGLELVEARLVIPGSGDGGLGSATSRDSSLADLRLYEDYQPLPATIAGNAPITDGRMWVAVKAATPGEHSFDSVSLDYRLGLLTFTAVMHHAVVACVGPMPSEATCSIDSN